jgi:hypothetical protein
MSFPYRRFVDLLSLDNFPLQVSVIRPVRVGPLCASTLLMAVTNRFQCENRQYMSL